MKKQAFLGGIILSILMPSLPSFAGGAFRNFFKCFFERHKPSNTVVHAVPPLPKEGKYRVNLELDLVKHEGDQEFQITGTQYRFRLDGTTPIPPNISFSAKTRYWSGEVKTVEISTLPKSLQKLIADLKKTSEQNGKANFREAGAVVAKYKDNRVKLAKFSAPENGEMNALRVSDAKKAMDKAEMNEPENIEQMSYMIDIHTHPTAEHYAAKHGGTGAGQVFLPPSPNDVVLAKGDLDIYRNRGADSNFKLTTIIAPVGKHVNNIVFLIKFE